MSGKNKSELKETIRRMDADLEKNSRALPSLENDWEFALLGMQYDVIDQVQRAMETEKVSQSDLARAMGVSRAYISKILNEKINLQMETIAKLAVALKRNIALRLIEKNKRVDINAIREPAPVAKESPWRKKSPAKPAFHTNPKS